MSRVNLYGRTASIGGRRFNISDRAMTFRVWLRKPRNIRSVGLEAIELVTTILRLSDGADLGRVTQPVRDGWAYNFASEGSAHGQWADLAGRTAREREFFGFPAYHPILERTGSYKRSWIDRAAPQYFERAHRRGSFAAGKFSGGGNQVVIALGSIDYRVETLSGGMQVPEGMSGDMFSVPLSGMSRPTHEGAGNVPPRPVTPISDSFSGGIGRALDFLLTTKAERVKTRDV